MTKRLFDFSVSLILVILFSPVFLFITLLILIDSRGGVLYLQCRVGKGGREFSIFKFRTMRPDSDKNGLLTVGGRDKRITNAGFFLRKYKLDELPQLFNVLLGNMSLVGPRPEVKKYVDLYNEEQKRILKVKPGITDYASILYVNENEILGKSADPEKDYIEIIMPAKLELNKRYIEEANFFVDVKIIFLTLSRIISSR